MKTFLVGGARSGKSHLAEQAAAATGRPVAAVVTAEAIDDEMSDRIARHQADRPNDWATIEAPYDLLEGLEKVPAGHTLIVDCVTVWLSNLVVRGDDDQSIETAASEAISALVARPGDVLVVSNEVGLGLVPPDPMSRRFRDAQGRINQQLASRFDRSFLVAAGRLLPLHSPDELLS